MAGARNLGIEVGSRAYALIDDTDQGRLNIWELLSFVSLFYRSGNRSSGGSRYS